MDHMNRITGAIVSLAGMLIVIAALSGKISQVLHISQNTLLIGVVAGIAVLIVVLLTARSKMA